MTTSVNTQVHVSKLAVYPVTGSGYFEISIDVYYDPATLNTSSYFNFVCGRGNNTGMHSGMMIPGGLNEAAFEGRWRLQNTGSTISKTGLTADWYRYSMTVTEKTFQIKLLNLRTNVLLSGNVVNIGTVDTADNFRFTFLSYGIDETTAAYGSVGVNFSNARITRNGVTLVNLPFSAGAGTQVINVYNGTVYDLGFLTPSAGWAKLSDYYHYNFRNGFTLYQKSGSSDIRIANKIDGTETTYTPPTGYARIANYKGTTTSYNQCESKFKLDDVSATVQKLFIAGSNIADMNGWYDVVGENEGKPYYDNATGYRCVYSSGYWYLTPLAFSPKYRSSINGIGFPWLVNVFLDIGGGLPVPVATQEPFGLPSPLYLADPDHLLFTVDTGVAKEFVITGIDFNYDRGYLYINSDVQETNFMLYGTDKTLENDLKVLKYVEQFDRVTYDEETGLPNYDEANHAELTE